MQKIDRVGNLDADFQSVSFVQTVYNCHNIVIEHQLFKISDKKQKKNSFDKTNPNMRLTIEIA